MKATELHRALVFAAGLVLAGGYSTSAKAADAEADVSVSASSSDAANTDDDSSAFIAAGKVGGIMPFSGLKPFVAGGVELGWIFAGTSRRIAALLDVSYTTPSGSGDEKDARLGTGSYSWEVTQKELVFQPTFLYRFTGSRFVPYAGIGPRIYLLETVGEGSSGGAQLDKTDERSTKLGVGVPLGAEYQLGPGALMAEVLLQWAPLDHSITGDSNLGAATLFLGYRAML